MLIRRNLRALATGPDRDAVLEERAARQMASARATASLQVHRGVAVSCDADVPAPPVAKSHPVRSEAYRRAVASLPCICCGVPGISQCAHANTGKGAGIKASDLDSFPLCACQPGRRGCHSKFDQGALFLKTERRLIEPAWIADTQRRIRAMGLWPVEEGKNEQDIH